jgi:hypothetical protein
MRNSVLCALLLLYVAQARAQWAELNWADPGLRWRTLETEHFSVHFAEHYRQQARIAAMTAEKVYPRVTSLLDWQPRRRTELVLLDSADFANGFASPVPFNFTGIFLSPPDEGELLQNRDWLELVLSHEFFHVVHLDKASGRPLALRDVLGRLLPFFPNVLQPTWIVEGLAVNNESEAIHGYGRLENSYFEGMMRAEASRGFRSLREVNAQGRGFPLNRDYLYGSYFFAFVRERYGERAVEAFIRNYSANVVPFKVQSNAAAATGKPMDELWVEYQAWLLARFGGARADVIEGDVLARAFSLSSPMLTEDGTRWYVQADGYTRPKLMRQARGEPPQPVTEMERDTRLTTDGERGVIAAELDICGNHNLLYGLVRIDNAGHRQPLSRCARHRFAAVLDDGRIAAVQVITGRPEVVILGGDRVPTTLYRASQGDAISGLAARGARIVITTRRNGAWALLDVSRDTPVVLVSDAAVKHSPRFGDSADEIFFVADYDKRYDVWSWRAGRQLLGRWTRAAHGVREVSSPARREMLLTTIEADGDALRLHSLPPQPLEEHQFQRAENAPVPPVAAAGDNERAYTPWRTLRPTAWAPILQIADGAVALGALTYGIDALQLHEYFVAPMVELTQREVLGRIEYLYDGRHGLVANRTLTVREAEPDGSRTKIRAYSVREDAQWVYLQRSLTLNRRVYWGGGAALEQEDIHDLQLGISRVQNERVLGLVAGIDTRRGQWLSEGPSQGQELRLFAETSRGLGAAYGGNAYRADARAHFPLGRSVLSMRWNEAFGQDNAEPFELGGSKSDDVIVLPVLNERDFALRGYTTGTPELMGHRARTATVEWRSRLADIDRHLMVPPVGMNRLSFSAFFDIGAAWERGGAADYHRGIGAELIAEPRFGYLFGLQTRFGVAKGLDHAGSTKIYLRAGRAF